MFSVSNYRYDIDAFVAGHLPDWIDLGQVGDDQTGTGPIVPRFVEKSSLVVIQN